MLMNGANAKGATVKLAVEVGKEHKRSIGRDDLGQR
jgi:hypothetical protein